MGYGDQKQALVNAVLDCLEQPEQLLGCLE